MSTKQSWSKPRSPKNTMKRVRQELLTWICEKHATNSPLSRDALREKALQLREDFGLIGFKCSKLWITNFLKSYGFSPTLTSCDGPIFDDYRKWIDLLRKVFTKYKHKDFFCVDELIMLPNVLPKHVQSLTAYISHSDKPKVDKITICFCCNSSGKEKLPLLISGPYKNEDTEENMEYMYCYNENSEISDETFARWLAKFNKRLVQENREVLLLIHRRRIRISRDSRLSNINFVFFPKGFPTKLCPMRRELFHYFKMNYRQEYAKEIEKGELMKWSWDRIRQTLLLSWRSIPRELIMSSFQKTTFRTDDHFFEYSNPDFWHASKSGISFRKYVTFDDNLSKIPSPSTLGHQIISQDLYDLRSCRKRSMTVCFDDEKGDTISRNDPPKKKYQKFNTKSADQDNDNGTCIIINLEEDDMNDSADKTNDTSSSDVHIQDCPHSSDDSIQIDDPDSFASMNQDSLMDEPNSSNILCSKHSLDSCLVWKSTPNLSQSQSCSKTISAEISGEFNRNKDSQLTNSLNLHATDQIKNSVMENGEQSKPNEDNEVESLGSNEGQNESKLTLLYLNPYSKNHNKEVSSDTCKINNEIEESSEDNWAKKFEKNFVFGPNVSRNLFTQSSKGKQKKEVKNKVALDEDETTSNTPGDADK